MAQNGHYLWASLTLAAYFVVSFPVALGAAFVLRLNRIALIRSACACAIIAYLPIVMFVILVVTRWAAPVLVFFVTPVVLLLIKDFCDRNWLKAVAMMTILITAFTVVSMIVELALVHFGYLHS